MDSFQSLLATLTWAKRLQAESCMGMELELSVQFAWTLTTIYMSQGGKGGLLFEAHLLHYLQLTSSSAICE